MPTKNISTGSVAEVELMETKDTSEKLAAEKVDLKTLTKEELIRTIEFNNKSIANYEATIVNLKQEHVKTLEETNKIYKQHLENLTSLINYYERKFKILSDILNIETGTTDNRTGGDK